MAAIEFPAESVQSGVPQPKPNYGATAVVCHRAHRRHSNTPPFGRPAHTTIIAIPMTSVKKTSSQR